MPARMTMHLNAALLQAPRHYPPSPDPPPPRSAIFIHGPLILIPSTNANDNNSDPAACNAAILPHQQHLLGVLQHLSNFASRKASDPGYSNWSSNRRISFQLLIIARLTMVHLAPNQLFLN